MPLVSIEADAKYRWEEASAGYLEICGQCGEDRRGENEQCACGYRFARSERGFFVFEWKPADLSVLFPDFCPHCGGEPTKTVGIDNTQYTRLVGRHVTHRNLQVPVCAKVRAPLLLYFAGVITAFLAVVSALLAVAHWSSPRILLDLLLVAVFGVITGWLWRARSWIRFAAFDHRSYRFKVVRSDYAHALARRNRGRVL